MNYSKANFLLNSWKWALLLFLQNCLIECLPCSEFSGGMNMLLSMDQGSVRVTLQQEFRTKADGAFAQIKKTLHFFSTEKKNCLQVVALGCKEQNPSSRRLKQ